MRPFAGCVLEFGGEIVEGFVVGHVAVLVVDHEAVLVVDHEAVLVVDHETVLVVDLWLDQRRLGLTLAQLDQVLVLLNWVLFVLVFAYLPKKPKHHHPLHPHHNPPHPNLPQHRHHVERVVKLQ